MTEIEALIHQGWEVRESVRPGLTSPLAQAVEEALKWLHEGRVRVAEKKEGQWQVHEWLKKAILLSFRLRENSCFEGQSRAYDKIPLKFDSWSESDFMATGIRVVPGAVVRHSAYIAPQAVLMPSFVNVGAYIGHGTMVDTWATVGSCVQVGERCHISGGAGLGGVLEPLQANPVIIEDNCFIGARSEIVEGVVVEQGAVIGMGVFIGASTPVVCRTTGAITYGRVPAYSVVISGSMPTRVSEQGPAGLSLSCAVIVKQVDERTRSKTSVNDLLRAV